MIMINFLLVAFGILIIFLATSLRYVPAHPPHIAVVTFLGRRLRKFKGEGLRLFPFHPILFNAILVDVSTKNHDLLVKARTPDLAEAEISVSLSWSPLPAHAIEYLNRGGEGGVRKMISDATEEAVRQWMIATEEGPRDFEEALRTGQGTRAILFRTIAGLPLELPKAERDQMLQTVTNEKGFSLPQLGIVLDFLRITKVTVGGVVVDTTELISKEKKQKEVEMIKFGYLQEIMLQLKEFGLSTEQALELAQTERGRVSKKIDEMKLRISIEDQDKVVRLIERLIDRK